MAKPTPPWKFRLADPSGGPVFANQLRVTLTHQNRAITDSQPNVRQSASGNSRAVVEGGLVTQTAGEAGENLSRGDNVALESDGFLYKTRATALGTENTAGEVTTSHSEAVSTTDVTRSVAVSGTVLVHAFRTNSATRVARTVVDPESTAITSQTISVIKANNGTSCDIIKLTDNVAVIAYGVSGDSTIYAKVLSGLDTGVTQGSELSINTTNTPTGIRLAKVSSSEVVIFASNPEGNNDIVSYRVTVAGTTLTDTGTSTTLDSGASSYTLKSAERFGDSDAYMLSFWDSSAVQVKVIGGTYDTGTITYGAAVAVGTSSSSCASSLGSRSDLLGLVSLRDNSGNIKVAAITRTPGSGTLSVGATTTLDTGVATCNVTTGRVGGSTFAIGFVSSTASNKGEISLVRVQDGDTVAELDQEQFDYDGSATEVSPAIVKIAPNRLVMTAGDYDGTQGVRSFTIDMTTNFGSYIGVVRADTKARMVGAVITSGSSPDPTGLTPGVEYFADIDGAYATEEAGGTKRVGMATATNVISVQH